MSLRPSDRMKLALICSAAMTACLALAECGVKSPPIPPEYAAPERIDDLSAESVRTGVRLYWSRPTTYVGGGKMRDLARFRILRAVSQGQFAETAEIPVTDQERFQQQKRFTWLDAATEMDHTYRYEVIAETADQYVSRPSNIVNIKRELPPPPPNPENFVMPTPKAPPSAH